MISTWNKSAPRSLKSRTRSRTTQGKFLLAFGVVSCATLGCVFLSGKNIESEMHRRLGDFDVPPEAIKQCKKNGHYKDPKTCISYRKDSWNVYMEAAFVPYQGSYTKSVELGDKCFTGITTNNSDGPTCTKKPDDYCRICYKGFCKDCCNKKNNIMMKDQKAHKVCVGCFSLVKAVYETEKREPDPKTKNSDIAKYTKLRDKAKEEINTFTEKEIKPLQKKSETLEKQIQDIQKKQTEVEKALTKIESERKALEEKRQKLEEDGRKLSDAKIRLTEKTAAMSKEKQTNDMLLNTQNNKLKQLEERKNNAHEKLASLSTTFYAPTTFKQLFKDRNNSLLPVRTNDGGIIEKPCAVTQANPTVDPAASIRMKTAKRRQSGERIRRISTSSTGSTASLRSTSRCRPKTSALDDPTVRAVITGRSLF